MRRYVAVSHNLTVEASEDGLENSWESIRALCAKLDCELLESSVQKKTTDAPGSASIKLRIAPADLEKLFDKLGKSATIVQHSTESEDKTAAVIDTEAGMQNQTGYRDSLRTMLAKPSATFKDVLEVQRELVKVQSELDALATKRKVLAAETEKVLVQISFRQKQTFASRSFLSPISNALGNAGITLGESLAALITIIMVLVPWLLAFAVFIWAAKRLGFRLRPWRTKNPPSSGDPSGGQSAV